MPLVSGSFASLTSPSTSSKSDIIPARSSLCSSPASFQSASRLYYWLRHLLASLVGSYEIIRLCLIRNNNEIIKLCLIRNNNEIIEFCLIIKLCLIRNNNEIIKLCLIRNIKEIIHTNIKIYTFDKLKRLAVVYNIKRRKQEYILDDLVQKVENYTT